MRIELFADATATAQDLRDLLLLVGEDVPVERIGQWAPLERCVVADWAARVHLRASDNLARERPRPSLLGPVEEPRPADGFRDFTCGACGETHSTNFSVDEVECPECGARRCPCCRAWFGGDRG